MYLWQLSIIGFLQFYDTGVYLAASIHLVSGIMPYRDFVFVQPPGIMLLMSPVALFSRVFGSHDGFVLARVVSAVVTALNAVLLAWLVRHRGRVAMLIAGAGLVLLPVDGFVSSGLRLEPFCICFILFGSLVIFSNEHGRGRLSTRQLAIGGVLFGFAALIKIWACFPLLALVVCLLPRYRSRVLIFLGAALSGFIVFSLPFFLSAPRNFVSEVFVEQIFRRADVVTGAEGVVGRLADMTGFSYTAIAPTGAEVVIAFIGLLCLVAIAYGRRFEREAVDFYLLLAAVFTVAALLAAPEYYSYYGYFVAPFLLGVLAISIGRLAPSIRKIVDRLGVSMFIHRLVASVTALAATVLIVALVLYSTTFYSFAARFGISSRVISPITRYVPAGSCVLYTEVAFGVFTNRLQASQPNCPSVVDPGGLWLKWGDHLVPPAPAFVLEWKSFFVDAQYVVSQDALIGRQSEYVNTWRSSVIPWDRGLTRWFKNHYSLVFGHSGLYIYAKVPKV
jgi:hypothetical protein